MSGLMFSDTTSRQGLIQDCEDNLNFPAAGISGTTALLQQFTREINTWYHKVLTMILASQDSWDFDDATITTTNPIATRAMVASQRDYTFSTALWSLVAKETQTNTPTITIATPAVVTLTNHGMNVGDRVQFTTTGALPTGITSGTTYYIISTGFTNDSFQVSASFGGTAVNTSGTQSGTHSLTRSLLPFKIKRIDVTYDGSTWYKAELYDTGMGSFGQGNDTNTDANFDRTKPFYDITANGISIYVEATSTDVSNGGKIRVEFTRGPIEFLTTDTTRYPGFDPSFHRILSLGACFDYALIKSLPTANGILALLQDYETRLKQYYGLKDTDTQFYLSGTATLYT